MHVADRVRRESLVHVVGDVGLCQRVRVLDEHAGDIQGDVARADHCHRLGIQRPCSRHVGVAAVPGDEVRGTERSRQVDAGKLQRRVPQRTGGDDDGIVRVAEFTHRDVDTDLDVAQESNTAVGEYDMQRVADLLDPRMIRGDPVPDQPEGDGQTFEQVDPCSRCEPRKVGGSVNSGRTGSHDRDLQRPVHIRHGPEGKTSTGVEIKPSDMEHNLSKIAPPLGISWPACLTANP